MIIPYNLARPGYRPISDRTRARLIERDLAQYGYTSLILDDGCYVASNQYHRQPINSRGTFYATYREPEPIHQCSGEDGRGRGILFRSHKEVLQNRFGWGVYEHLARMRQEQELAKQIDKRNAKGSIRHFAEKMNETMRLADGSLMVNY